MINENLNSHFGIRANREQVEAFKNHCQTKLGKPHAIVLREMMTALVEDRLSVTPTKAQAKAQSKLYG